MNKPNVSIIVPVYNAAGFIHDTINSIFNQTYNNYEILVIDDDSKDDTVKIIQRLKSNEKRIKLINLDSNFGPATARNYGIKNATGKYIAFLDSDDIWLPHKLEKQIGFMEKNNSNFSFTSYRLCDEAGIYLNKRTTAPAEISYKELLKYNWIGTSTVMFNAETLGKHYMPYLRNRQDWGLWLSLIKKAKVAHFIDEPLVEYKIRQNSISKGKIRLIKYHWRIYREVENFNLLKSSYFLGINLINHLKKDKIIND